MSFDLIVEGGRHVTPDEWASGCAAFGVNLALDAESLDGPHGSFAGEVSVDGARPGWASKLVRARAELVISFHTFGPGASSAMLGRRIDVLRAQLQALAERDAPDMILEDRRSKIIALERAIAGDITGTQHAVFSTSTGRSRADYVAQVSAATSYAAASGGTLIDPSSDGPPATTAAELEAIRSRLFAIDPEA